MTELARRTLLWLATIAIGVGCGATNPPHASVDPPPPVGNLRRLDVPEAGRAYHGVLPAGTTEPDSDVSPRALDGYEQTVGRKVAYVYFSTDWFRSRAFPSNTAGWIRDRGSVPFIRLMMRSQRQPRGQHHLGAPLQRAELSRGPEERPRLVLPGRRRGGLGRHLRIRLGAIERRSLPDLPFPRRGHASAAARRHGEQAALHLRVRDHQQQPALRGGAMGARGPGGPRGRPLARSRGFAWWQERWNNDGAAGSDMLVQDDPAVAAAFRSALTGPGASSVVDAPLLR